MDAASLQSTPDARLLVVASAGTLTDLVLQMLGAAGHPPGHQVVGSLVELAAVLEREPWDLMLVSDGRPGLSVADAAEVVRSQDPDLPFIVVSDAGGEAGALDALRLGAADFVPRRDLAQLVPAVERVVAATRRRRQASLVESERKFRTVVEGSLQGVVVHRRLRPLFVNEAFVRLVGYEGPEQVLALGSLRRLVATEDWEQLLDSMRKGNVGPEAPPALECRVQRRDGSLVWVDCMVVKTTWEERPAQLLALVDATARKEAQRRAEQQQALLQAVFETNPLLMFVKDAEGRYLMVNQWVLEAWGVDAGDLIGHRLDEVRSRPESERQRNGDHDRLILSGAVPRIEDINTMLHADGSEHIVRTVKRPLYDESRRICGIVGFSDDVTALEHAQRAVRESMALLQATFDALPHLVFVKDHRGQYMIVNRRFAEAVAMAPTQVIGTQHTAAMIRPEHERQRALEIDGQILRGELPRSDVVQQLRYADGVLRAMRCIKEPLKDETGRIYGLVGVAEDITRLHEAEVEATVAHARLADAVQHLEAAFYLYDRDEQLVLWNSKVYELFPDLEGRLHHGMLFEEVLRIATPTVEALPEGFEAQIQRRLAEFRNPPEAPLEQRLRDGRWLLVRDRKTAEGGTVCLRQEVTGLKATEAALRRSEAQFRLLTENAPDMIFRYRLSPERGFDYVSPVATAITGYTPAEHYADPDLWLRIAHPDDLEEQQNLLEMNEESAGALVQVRWRYKDAGWVWMEERSLPVFDDAGNLVAIEGVVRDVSTRKDLEDQLLQAQRMEAVGRLAGGIAHDFNNMLSVMSGYSAFVLEQLPEDSPACDDVKVIQNAVERSAALTRQLLAFSRKQVLRMETVDLNALVPQTQKMLRRMIGEDVALETLLSPELGAVTADLSQIEQIIMNLAVNARDAMPSGGTLTLATENVVVGKPRPLAHGDLKPGAYVMLAVTDTGTGMTEEVRRQIFEPFFTTKDVGQGTGLGLATVYGIVKQMGGEIDVESELGHGSSFRIFLPRTEPSPCAPGEAADPDAAASGHETILLVEDEEMVRFAARRILERHGYRVLPAANAAAAQEIARESEESIDLLLTDVVMPGLSGPQLVEKLGAEQPDLHVLYMTGYTENTIVQHLGPGQLPEIVHKPFSPDALLHGVRRALRGPEG
ncbi:MAG TPA: PAS domain S-box protein [bacterium]|nr:PAS domain S-box protein [bacterium]